MNDAQERPPRIRRHGRRGIAFVLVLALLLTLKIVNYGDQHALHFDTIATSTKDLAKQVRQWYNNTSAFHQCDSGTKIDVAGGYVCFSGDVNSVYDRIYSSYRAVGGDKATPYPDTILPNRSAADALLHNQVAIPRFDPVTADPSTDWSTLDEGSNYWRFYYYSLRQTVPLTLAYEDTGNAAYADKAQSMIDGFEAGSATSKLMWEDPHSVAFRALSLVWQWWNLREAHRLTQVESAALLAEIGKTADFLASPNNFQPDYNHGLNEATALLAVAVDFPDLPGAQAWLTTALDRIESERTTLIDADGSLLESSAYYHFYALSKLWQLRNYATSNNISLGEGFNATLDSMIDFGTQLIRPDGSVPLLGASLATTIHRKGAFAQIAESHPAFMYAVTQGAEGTAGLGPGRTFPAAGLTVLQDGGTGAAARPGRDYLTFNVGAYRSLHNHLDLMGVTLFGEGTDLLPDAGLYTYDPGKMFDYFHGTSAHNVVVVDGKDQSPGSVESSGLNTTDGVTVQSAATEAYPGVADQRTLAQVDVGVFLVIDNLAAKESHSYDQTWHFMQGASVTTDGLSITAQGASPLQRVTVRQLSSESVSLVPQPSSSSDPIRGLCSTTYGRSEECAQFSFRQTGTAAAYVTLITAGAADATTSAEYDAGTGVITVVTASGSRSLRITTLTDQARTVSSSPVSAGTTTITPLVPNTASWSVSGGSAGTFENGAPGFSLLGVGRAVATAAFPKTDLAHRDLKLRLRMSGTVSNGHVTFSVASSSTRGRARLNILSLYDLAWAGEWVTLSLPTNSSSALEGRWTAEGSVDWAAIDSVEISVADSGAAPDVRLDLDCLGTTAKQNQAMIAFIFDDGYSSIIPAAQVLHDHGMPANVAVIGRQIATPQRFYLSVKQLLALQNDWGWNMANHTQYHRDLVNYYKTTASLAAFERDLIDGQQRLKSFGLDSAPNWLIYPHGSTTALLDSVVSKYYTFARTTLPGFDSYPFGSPLRIHNFEVHNPNGPDDTSNVLTTPATVSQAIADAKESNATLILTFHRIYSVNGDRPGYPLEYFSQIVDAVAASGVPVKTLSQLDAAYGVQGRNDIVVDAGHLGMQGLEVTSFQAAPGPSDFWHWLGSLFNR